MTRILADEKLHVAVKQAQETLQVYDESGKILGIFCPTNSDLLKDFPALSAEELARRRNSPDWLTTEELLNRLKASRS